MTNKMKYTARVGYKGAATKALRLTPDVKIGDPSKQKQWKLEVDSNGWWEIDDLEILFKRGSSDCGSTGKCIFNIQLIGDGWEYLVDTQGSPLDGMLPCETESSIPDWVRTTLTRDRKTLILEVDCLRKNTHTMRFDFRWAAKLNGEEYLSSDPGLEIPPPNSP